MRIRIYLVRHAEARSNIDPFFEGEDTLSDVGVAQATALTERFKSIPIKNIYTSKVPRARLTASEIGKSLNLEPTQLGFLKERKGVYSRPGEYEHKESFEDVTARLVETKNFLESLSEKYVVVVSHAIFLKTFASFIMLGEDFTEQLSTSILNTLTLDHATISKFVYNKGKNKWHIESWNEQSTLFDTSV